MNKKAASVMMIIFEILVVLMVSYILTSIAQSYAESITTVKINTANDIQMMVNALVAVPGESVVKYPTNVSALTFIMDTNGIAVFQKGEPEVKWQVRQFSLPQGYVAEGTLEEKSWLCLEKKNKKILLRECQDDEP